MPLKEQQTLQIHQLEANCLIGVWPHEQKKRQPLFVDFVIHYHAPLASTSDELKDTLNYSEFTQEALRFIQTHHFQLLETLSRKLAEFLFEKFSMQALEITIHKPKALRKLAKVLLKSSYTPCSK